MTHGGHLFSVKTAKINKDLRGPETEIAQKCPFWGGGGVQNPVFGGSGGGPGGVGRFWPATPLPVPSSFLGSKIPTFGGVRGGVFSGSEL